LHTAVGNLAYDLSEQDVIDYFSSVGPVKAVRIVLDKETGKPRGFGFVEYHDIPTAESCVRNLGGTELNGRTMRIVFAQNDGGTAGGARGGRGGGFSSDRGSLFSNKSVGSNAVIHASKGAGETMGLAFDPTMASSRMVSILSRKNKNDMYTYLEQVQQYCEESPEHAREFLGQNPMLCQAILVMEILLGLVANPLDDPAAGGGGSGAMGSGSMGAMGGGMPVPPPPGGGPPPPPPRPMVSMRQAGSAPPRGMPPANINEQQQALLAQVMNLTPEQIELLPAQQRAQVLALQQQMKG
jgi:cleavage stimulation factor subunit 2